MNRRLSGGNGPLSSGLGGYANEQPSLRSLCVRLTADSLMGACGWGRWRGRGCAVAACAAIETESGFLSAQSAAQELQLTFLCC